MRKGKILIELAIAPYYFLLNVLGCDQSDGYWIAPTTCSQLYQVADLGQTPFDEFESLTSIGSTCIVKKVICYRPVNGNLLTQTAIFEHR